MAAKDTPMKKMIPFRYGSMLSAKPSEKRASDLCRSDMILAASFQYPLLRASKQASLWASLYSITGMGVEKRRDGRWSFAASTYMINAPLRTVGTQAYRSR